MKLLTKELINKLPKLGAIKDQEDPKALVKLFTPWTDWTWYILEYDSETEQCYGIADGFFKELGYFDLKEIKEITGPGGIEIERDKHFEPKNISEIMGGD